MRLTNKQDSPVALPILRPLPSSPSLLLSPGQPLLHPVPQRVGRGLTISKASSPLDFSCHFLAVLAAKLAAQKATEDEDEEEHPPFVLVRGQKPDLKIPRHFLPDPLLLYYISTHSSFEEQEISLRTYEDVYFIDLSQDLEAA
jgi:hypothetical protein